MSGNDNASPTPKTVLETVLEWSLERPDWQRDALRRIVAKGRLLPADAEELTVLCKKGKGATGITVQAAPLQKSHLPANPGQHAAVSISALSGVLGANNLAPNQTLSFEAKGLTIVYGDNGAGKSGYARILKRACRARHAGKIEPNIYAEAADGAATAASANITYGVGGNLQPPEKWTDAEKPHSTLSAVSVFDRESASVHISGENEVAFRPFGLDVPDELAGTCQAVKDLLTKEQKDLEKARHPLFGKPTWKETTRVGKALKDLKHDTNFKEIELLGTLSDEDKNRLSQLREDLAKAPDKAAAQQTLKAENLSRLLGTFRNYSTYLSNEALSAIVVLRKDAKQKREASRLAADKAFSGEQLPGIGGESWRLLWESARRYSTEVAYPSQSFPATKEDAKCVLCHQSVEGETVARLARFEEFVQLDTETQARDAEDEFEKSRKFLFSIVIDTRSLKSNLGELNIQSADAAKQARRFIASMKLRRWQLKMSLDRDSPLSLIQAQDPSKEIGEIEQRLRAYAEELRKSANPEARKRLESELAELSDRELLGTLLDTVEEEIARLSGISFLADCITETATAPITKLGNDIADTVITPKLRDRFQEEIVNLAAEKVRVEIVRSGGKLGSPQYQVRLFAKPKAKVRDILSEGEQTCVALAAFLTELATATHRSALVFDDPVTSLDHRWRKKVAERLVQEAAQRQIVVFTHDLIFVTDLDDLAASKKVATKVVTVFREQAGAGVISDGLPWKGTSVEDRIDKLEKAARAAKAAYDENREDDYASQAATIYNNLRATWERALEDIVFHRVVQRHRDYIDTKNLKKVTVLSEADCDSYRDGFKKCCDVVDAHDPSKGRNAAPPAPPEIIKDLEAFKAWVKDIRERQKKVA